ncbi:hypothetical protein NDU88_002226 [Pleurodeles waltl]|uniref:Uncharacterized protein n=1 Tax=Pleurodeles waltl TaxID=8319 RepID=A0AAV7RAB4_PLEWA|nr:hypothetical protein NDU88_002226 [Pleurodeles waltl]
MSQGPQEPQRPRGPWLDLATEAPLHPGANGPQSIHPLPALKNHRQRRFSGAPATGARALQYRAAQSGLLLQAWISGAAKAAARSSREAPLHPVENGPQSIYLLPALENRRERRLSEAPTAGACARFNTAPRGRASSCQ